MPILLQYGPIGAGAAVAGNIASFKEAQIREQERQRNQQALEEQQRYDQAMARQREQDRLNEDYKRQSLDLEGQRISGLNDYRDQQGNVAQQRLDNMDKPSDRFARLEERARLRGAFGEAEFLRKQKLQAQQQEYQGGQNELNRQNVRGIADQSYDLKKTQADENLAYKIKRDQEHDELVRSLSEQKMAALHRAATARTDAERRRELKTAAELDLRVAMHITDRHFRLQPKADPITGQIDQNAMAAWSNQHRQLVEQERAAKAAADQLLTGTTPTLQANNPRGLDLSARRDTPQAFQNDPLQEAPIIPSRPTPPIGQPSDIMNEANGSAPAVIPTPPQQPRHAIGDIINTPLGQVRVVGYDTDGMEIISPLGG